MKTIRMLVLGGMALLACSAVRAQSDPKPKVYALVSAIGSEITYVRQRQQTGTHLPPYRRYTLPVPDASVDTMVLRGLDRAVAQEDPDSKRIYLRLAPEEVRGVLPYKRGDVLAGKVAAALDRMPERGEWDRIILVTPRYVGGAREGMGEKLHGIGIYVQPLGRNVAGNVDSDLETATDPDTVSPSGEKSTSYKYVAPYFYAQIWILDAKTMQVLETRERYDFQRLYDPKSTAIDVAKQIPVEQLAELVERFVERASSHALNESIGEVIVKEPRIIDPRNK
jgi:hypothetical protein